MVGRLPRFAVCGLATTSNRVVPHGLEGQKLVREKPVPSLAGSDFPIVKIGPLLLPDGLYLLVEGREERFRKDAASLEAVYIVPRQQPHDLIEGFDRGL